jgi:hypothetical protein
MHAFDKEYDVNVIELKFSLILVLAFPPHQAWECHRNVCILWNWVIEFPQVEMRLSSRHDSVVATSFVKAIAQCVGEIGNKVRRL